MQATPNRKVFVSGVLFLTVFIGILIPSNFIAASPQEYVDVAYFHHPLWFIVSSTALAAGTFLIWLNVFYWLANPKWKVIFERIIWILCGSAIVNYMFFGTDLGVISNNLKYENGLTFSDFEIFINIVVVLLLAAVLCFVAIKWIRAVKAILLTGTLALFVMSGINVFAINSSVNEIKVEQTDSNQLFQLSKEGNNVVVILLDRAMGQYVPYIFNEVDGLEEQFDGFTYYSNTISYGGHTNMGVPALMGGYEYTPVELNKRDTESLKDKHNESLKVMPVLFSENGYNVTVCDAPYANYSEISDMSIYDEYADIATYHTEGTFGNSDMKQAYIDNNHRNFFCFAIMKSLPLCAQYGVYNEGNYNQSYTSAYSGQKTYGMYTSEGYYSNFMEPYEVLRNLDVMTGISEEGDDNFLFLYNDATHEPMMLQEPEYLPAEKVDNTVYESLNSDRFTLDGKTVNVTNQQQLIHYQANAAALIQLGEWFDYLRENEVYDNTKIILVSDHAYYLNQSDELFHANENGNEKYNGVQGDDMSNYFPLLMVKDFNSEGFTMSDEFMTNADVPTIATDGTIENPVNPFTGEEINNSEKTAHDQLIMLSRHFRISSNNGNTFTASRWAAITDDIWNREDWEFFNGSAVLKKHELP